MKLKLLAGAAAAAAALGSAMLFAGARWHRPPATLFEGYDTSKGYRAHLADAATRGAQVAARLDPEVDRIIMERVDSETRTFYDNVPPVSSDAMLETLNRELKPLPMKDGTYMAAFFTDVDRRAAEIQGNIAVIYYSDGDNDNPGKAADYALCKAGKDLADNPRVCAVIFADVSPENRDRIRREFGALGSRLHLFGVTDSDGAALSDLCEESLGNARDTR